MIGFESGRETMPRLSALMLTVLAALSLLLGETYSVIGRVCNAANQQTLEGANISVREINTAGRADKDGMFRIILPAPGLYELEASFIGFENQCRMVMVADAQPVILNFELRESYISIEGVCVRSTRPGVAFTNQMTVVDVEKFTAANRAYRVEEILSQMAGIDIYRTGTVATPSQLVSMRGFNDLRFVVAVDGRPWSGPSHNDSPIDWSALTTGDIERIELIRGGSAAQYEGALGGIINIVRKRGMTGSGITRPRITAQIGGEAFRSAKGSVGVRGGLGPVGYSFNGGYDMSSGYLRNEHNLGYDIAAALDYILPAKGRASLSFKRHSTDFGYPVINDPLRADYDPAYPVVPEGGDLIRKWSDNVYPGGTSQRLKFMNFLDLSVDQPVSKANLALNLFSNMGDDTSYAYCYRLIQDIDTLGDTTLVPILQQQLSVTNEYTYGASFRTKLSGINQHAFSFGADYRNLGTFPMKEDTIMGIIVGGSDAIPDWFRNFGVYAEDQFKATAAVNITLGARWAYLDEWTMPTYKNPATGDSGRIHFYYQAFLPKVSASYTFIDSTMCYASVNRDWHIPNC
jgi:iron complex outermembrane receptor protein